MRRAGKVLLWLLMVLVLTALVVGGTVGYFYSQAAPGEEIEKKLTVNAAPAQGTQSEGAFVAPDGYEVEVPVLGGVLFRAFSCNSLDTDQTLQWNELEAVPLGIPEGCELRSVRVDGLAGELFSGSTQEEYTAFSFPGNGDYYYRVELELPRAEDGQRAQTYGVLTYRFMVKVSVEMGAFLSDDKVSQGSVVSVRIENNLDGYTPYGSSELGPVNFIPSGESGWVAFVPVSYNREAGDYTIEVQCGDYTASLPLTVTYKSYEKITFESADQLPDASTESAAASAAYRNAIWPLYDSYSKEQLWQGIFQRPVEGRIKYDFGIGSLLPGDTVSQRHSGIDYLVTVDESPVCAPAGGEVAFAGYLELTGNTVVIEHGGGVKSYFYHITTLETSRGEQLEKGQQIGLQNVADLLHYEIKIGNQSVAPGPIFDGNSGLYR